MLALVACNEERSAEPPQVVKERVQHIASAERVPPSDAVPGPNGTVMKVIRKGQGPVVGRDTPAFSGYAWTFYTDDGFDTGTSLELKTWTNANDYERAVLTGRAANDVVRVWDCTKKTKLNECAVSDYQVLSLPRNGV